MIEPNAHPAPTSHSSFPFGQEIVWRPVAEWVEQSNLKRFMDRNGIRDYDELVRRSTEDIEWFWRAVLDDLDIRFYRPYGKIVDLTDGAPFARWCVDGEMNIVYNCLDKWMDTLVRRRVALIWEGEDGSTRSRTFEELHHDVCRCANALRSLGIGKGDVVGLYMPMIPEIVVALLAVAKIGGIILPLFSGYGASAITARLNDAGARALFTASAYSRRGDSVAMKIVADEALVDAPSVEHTIVVEHLDLTEEGPWKEGRDNWWHKLVPAQPGGG